jgi:hypothetical protein
MKRKEYHGCHMHYAAHLEKRRALNLPTFLLFINYRKAYGNGNKGNTWQVLRECNIPGQFFFCVFFIGMRACRGPRSSIVCLQISLSPAGLLHPRIFSSSKESELMCSSHISSVTIQYFYGILELCIRTI